MEERIYEALAEKSANLIACQYKLFRGFMYSLSIPSAHGEYIYERIFLRVLLISQQNNS
jgi:hypothetical protein